MSRVWLVTGSSRGIGLAVVIAAARKPQKLQHLVEKYGSDRNPSVALHVTNNCDVVKAGHEKFGRNDVVVNTARYANLAATEDIAIDDFRAQVDASFLGDVYVTKAVLPILRRQGSGHILLVSSLGEILGSPGLCAYQASKWAAGEFSSVLSSKFKSLDINITVLEPGGIRLIGLTATSMEILAISKP
ncbi:hypothetical protein BKA56DRAFT_615196 [Ilyonectria sp. MPI-CAGE-AT-0026]|nr:hypothetical protein BKA56DRAFT_615196 [Ilyonectria sp. MPI-CAGE-AT-0026]